MRHLLKIFVAGLVAGALQMQPAKAAEPLEETCKLVSALTKDGGDGGTKAIVNMASHWPEADQIKLAAIMNPALQKFDYVGGDVYLVADLDDNMQEHLVTMRIKGVSMVYIRLIYQHSNSELRFAHIEFQEKFKKVASYAFAQKPEKLSCK